MLLLELDVRVKARVRVRVTVGDAWGTKRLWYETSESL